MNYLEKINNINLLMDKVQSRLDLSNASIYVESNYFKDSFEVGVEPVGIYVVVDDSLIYDSHRMELVLNNISTDYIFNVISESVFDSNFKDDTTKIV